MILLVEPQSHNNKVFFTVLHHGGKLSRLTLIYSFLFIPLPFCPQLFMLFFSLAITLSAFSFWSCLVNLFFFLICSGKFFPKTDGNCFFTSNFNFDLKATEYIRNLIPTGNASLNKTLRTPEICEQNLFYPLHWHVPQISLNETWVIYMFKKVTWKNSTTPAHHGCVRACVCEGGS